MIQQRRIALLATVFLWSGLSAPAQDRQQEPLQTTYERIIALHRQGKFLQAEPLMRQYVTELEQRRVPPLQLRQAYASYAALLRQLHKEREAKAVDAKLANILVGSQLAQPAANPAQENVGITGIKFVCDGHSLPRIARVFPGTPAEKADIRKDDRIAQIDGVAIKPGETQSDIFDKIIGKPGTTVQLLLLRNERSEIPVTMVRMPFSAIKDPMIRRDYLLTW